VTIEIRPLREDERERIFTLQQQAFNVPASRMRQMPMWSAGDARGAIVDGELVAMLRAYRFGHFFGGKAVPALGVGGVAVAAHARGNRVAETLMIETLREFRDQGAVISTLYPATVPLYRRCGYEYGGYQIRYRAPLEALPRQESPPCLPWDDDELDEIVACHRAWAETQSGVVDRPDWFWRDRVLNSSEDSPLYRYRVRENGVVTGYLIYTQEKHGDRPWGFDISCRDLVWTTPGAGAALLAFAGRHRSTGLDLVWTGGPGDALANLLPEQEANHDSSFRTMIRLVDVPAAFEARGYPSPLDAAVELQVDDPALGWSDAGWRIETAGGAAKVSPAPGARARVDVAALAALFSGMLSARDARRLGRLVAADEEIATLDAMLAGPPPYINDWF